ncbi:iunH [Symbiodinium sp. KB8]|nr:iunH [Symbiodinium sp. KB8]
MATGALTNVAVLLKTYPAVTRMLEAIVLMGGGFTRGNTRPFVEFNMETDPEAAAVVFNAGLGHTGAPFAMKHHKDQLLAHEFATGSGAASAVPAADPSKVGKGAPLDAAHAKLHGDAAEEGVQEESSLGKGISFIEPAVPMAQLGAAIQARIGAQVSVPGVTPGDASIPVPVVMLPLEVTHTALVTEDVLSRINALPGPTGAAPSRFAALIASLLVFFRDSYLHVEGMPDPPLHDPCAVAAVIDPTKFDFTHAHVFIDTHSLVSPGATVADLRNVYRLPSNARNAYVSSSMDVKWFWEVMLHALEAANAACVMNAQATEADPPASKRARKE